VSRKSSKGSRRPAWTNKELLTKLNHKANACKIRKQRQVPQEGNRDAVQACRGGLRKAKACLELNLMSNMTSNQKGFYKCISTEGKQEKMWAHC